MLTVDDIKKLAELFATKADLADLREGLRGEMAEGFRMMNSRFDQVFGELKEIRNELTINRHEHDDLDQRLSKVESTPTVAHELRSKKS
jgi:hypothetical protein